MGLMLSRSRGGLRSIFLSLNEACWAEPRLFEALRWGSRELLETIRSRLRESPLPVRLLPDHNIKTLLGQCGLFTDGLSLPVTIQGRR
jgi:hypothetical protein